MGDNFPNLRKVINPHIQEAARPENVEWGQKKKEKERERDNQTLGSFEIRDSVSFFSALAHAA